MSPGAWVRYWPPSAWRCATYDCGLVPSPSAEREYVTPGPLRPLEVVGLFPVVAVVVVGALYAMGFIVRGARLADAGISVGDALPLIPLEQLLAEGVSVVLPSLGLLAILGIAALPPVIAISRLPPATDLPTPTRGGAAAAQWALAVPFVIVAVFVTPIQAVCVGLIGAYAIDGIGRYVRATDRDRVVRVIGVTFVIVSYALTAGATIADRITAPEPLPIVEVTPIRGNGIRGELIASSGTVFYLKAANHTIAAVPNQRVDRAEFARQGRFGPRRVYQLIRDGLS
jgi:hypothetical protein